MSNQGICVHCGADRSGPSAEAHSNDCPEAAPPEPREPAAREAVDYAKWSREWFAKHGLSPQDFFVPDMLREFHAEMGAAFAELDKTGAVVCSTKRHEELRKLASTSAPEGT